MVGIADSRSEHVISVALMLLVLYMDGRDKAHGCQMGLEFAVKCLWTAGVWVYIHGVSCLYELQSWFAVPNHLIFKN